MFDISRYYQLSARLPAPPAIFSPSFLFFRSRSTHRRQHRSTPEDSLLRRPRETRRSYTMASERSVNNGSFPIKNSVCALARCYASLFSTGTPLFSSTACVPPSNRVTFYHVRVHLLPRGARFSFPRCLATFLVTSYVSIFEKIPTVNPRFVERSVIVNT